MSQSLPSIQSTPLVGIAIPPRPFLKASRTKPRGEEDDENDPANQGQRPRARPKAKSRVKTTKGKKKPSKK